MKAAFLLSLLCSLTLTLAFVCGPLPKEKFETCDSKGLSNCTKIGRSCYQYFRGPLSFYCANEFCRSRGCGGHLASIHSSRENNLVFNLVRRGNPSNPRGWIGGLRFPKTNLFIWSDGTKWNYNYWASNQPDNWQSNEDCVHFTEYNASRWNDLSCTTPQGFVCKFHHRG
ncbi:galactose-specific lectin nattectin-like isoform X2 [Acipenser ruthenus]|uniref:galactose-specific lectin nattectin-like isoform X2 n=1 Tax=Acipenser ruthenus TaxID=7906 RepID=UPI002741C361|nr:galactose-specific lectin nattectin-like isoform X2 [Acipenser ruthenus]